MNEENNITPPGETGAAGAAPSLAPQAPGEIHNPEDIAAAFFKMNKPKLKRLMDNMSIRQLKRFVMHVAAYPFTDAGDIPRTDDEKQAAYTFNEMVFNKTLMQLSVEMQRAEDAMKNEKENNSQQPTNTEENKNG